MRLKILQSGIIAVLKKKNINTIGFFLNLAIFLSIFAITSTVISIYYESKITNVEDKITYNQRIIDVIYPSIIGIPNRVRDLETTSDDIRKEQELIQFITISKISNIFSQRELYYNPTILLSSYLEAGFNSIEQYLQFMIYDSNFQGKEFKAYYEGIDQNDLIKIRNKNRSSLERYNEIKSSVAVSIKKNNFIEGNIEVVKNPKKFYEPYKGYLKEFKKFSKNQIDAYLLTKKTYTKIFINITNLNIKLSKEISINSNRSQKFILLAFFIQLIIFIIVQSMEIISTRREINEK